MNNSPESLSRKTLKLTDAAFKARMIMCRRIKMIIRFIYFLPFFHLYGRFRMANA